MDKLNLFTIVLVILFFLSTTGHVAQGQPKDHWDSLVTLPSGNLELRALAYYKDLTGEDRVFAVYRVSSETDSFYIESFYWDSGKAYLADDTYETGYIRYTGSGIPTSATCNGTYLYVATDRGYIFKIPAKTYGISEERIEVYQITLPSEVYLNITRIKYNPDYGFIVSGFDGEGYAYSIIFNRFSSTGSPVYYALQFKWTTDALIGLDAGVLYNPDDETSYLYSLIGSKLGALHLDVFDIKAENYVTTYRFTKEEWATKYIPGLAINESNHLVVAVMPFKNTAGGIYTRVFALRAADTPLYYREYGYDSGDLLIGVNIVPAYNGKIYITGSFMKGTGSYDLFMMELDGRDLAPLKALVYYGYYNDIEVRASQSVITDYIFLGATTDSFSDAEGSTSVLALLASPAQNGGELYKWVTVPSFSAPSDGLNVDSLGTPVVSSPTYETTTEITHAGVSDRVSAGIIDVIAATGDNTPNSYLGDDVTDPVPVPEPVLAVAGVLTGILVVLVSRSRALRA
ncbi:MAG: hypothetical protein F7C38_00530 [Desulfurococcales archaeon]|nr:hypothetical protein [Desulfurococcales archaeon]